MPLDDSDPYWAARFRMTPDQMDALGRKADETVRVKVAPMAAGAWTADRAEDALR